MWIAVGGTPLDSMWRRASEQGTSVGQWAEPLRGASEDRAAMVREVRGF